jgi:hypothetical protein
MQFTIGGGEPPDSYFGVAQSMMEGIKVLSAAEPCPVSALYLVAGHVVECLLKAYLSLNGNDSAVRKPRIRHNLEGLWRKASRQGLQIAKSPPNWLIGLNSLHGFPYKLRYSEGIQGFVGPSLQQTTDGLADLLRTMRGQLREGESR